MRAHSRLSPKRAGFTLVELLIVILIIGIIIAFILVAAGEGVQRAYERSTQTLITKIETGLNDRLEALMARNVDVNDAHKYIASITSPRTGSVYPDSWDRRAQVIALFDMIKAELPDVWTVNTQLATHYPINFAGVPYVTATQQAVPYVPQNADGQFANLAPYILPLGSAMQNTNPNGVAFPALPPGPGAIYNLPSGLPSSSPSGTGIFGASYSAASGIYKQLYTAVGVSTITGYDRVDNNGNGLVDELAESGMTNAQLTQFQALLANHDHKTARSEMLYAILVEGVGPGGSVFARDEFTAKEVQDTDGDGLLEFVDAWGEPLQFYRWPIYYTGVNADSQKGILPYSLFYEQRQQDPLDGNNTLVNPTWFSSSINVASSSNLLAYDNRISEGAAIFMTHFHSLLDYSYPVVNNTTQTWDRTGTYPRRAFFSKFLILSAGPDKEPGIARLARDYSSVANLSAAYNPVPATSLNLIAIENQASQYDPLARSGQFKEVMNDYLNTANATPVTLFLQNAGLDDISNQGLSSSGSIK